LEEHYEIPVEESRPEDQQQPATAEGHETEVLEQQQPATAEAYETEVLEQQQEKEEGGKKPSAATRKAIRLATISNLLEKQTTQMNKIGQMVQPLQKRLKSVETRTEFIKEIRIQLKQLQKQMSQAWRISATLRDSLGYHSTARVDHVL
jgi:hypothetical protein